MKAKSTHLPLMIFFLITVTSVYAQPVLLTNLSENAGNFISSGNTLYYAALDSLIKSNGTPAGTVLVKKLGEPVVAISPLTLNDHVFIITEESSGKKSLWKSDGTAEGTVKLGAFNSVQPLLVYQSELYLAIDNGITGTELYKLNASLSTVSLIKDIAPGSASGFAGELIESNDLLYFKANSGSGGINIWKSNGSFEGTALAVNLPFDNYEELTDVNGTIFFRRNHHDGVEKAAIWKSNGTSGGTVLVKEFEAEDEYMTVRIWSLVSFKNKLYYFYEAYAGVPYVHLGTSNGTTAGTELLKVVNIDGFVTPMKIAADHLVFTGNSQGFPTVFWKSDGTAGGTVSFHNINANPREYTGAGNFLFFDDHTDGMYGYNETPEGYYQLWQSDLTERNTKPLKDIFGGNYSGAGNLTAAGESLFFTTFNDYYATPPADRIRRLWYYNPTMPSGANPYFTLTDAGTDEDIAWLKDGDVVIKPNYQDINIRFNPVTAVGSVVFKLNGNTIRTENAAPYALAGDNNGDYIPWNVSVPGNYTLTSIPYSSANRRGTAGTPFTIHFRVVPDSTNAAPVVNAGPDRIISLPKDSVVLTAAAYDPDGSVASIQWMWGSGPTIPAENRIGNKITITGLTEGTYVYNVYARDEDGASTFDEVVISVIRPSDMPKVTAFVLVNADTDTDIGYFSSGIDEIYLTTLPTRNLNIRAELDDVSASKVVFIYDEITRTESAAPYAVFGDINGNYNGKRIPAGTHSLKAIPYGSSNIQGIAKELTFTVYEEYPYARAVADAEMSASTGPNLKVSPNPSNGIFRISLETPEAGKGIVEICRMDGTLAERLFEGIVTGEGSLEITWDGSGYPAGMYLCKFILEKEIIIEKIILTK